VSAAAYQFFPWVTRGIGTALSTADTGAALPDRLGVDVGVEVNGSVVATTNVQVHGPGDVLGIDPRQIVRTEPIAGSTDFEPNYFAHLELAEAALPWLFTPAAPDRTTDHLRPWCVLVVVAEQEGVAVGPGPVLPVLEIRRPANPDRELPDLAESWAWVHAQVVAEAGTTPQQALAGDDRLSLARLLCPRRLDPLTSYHACLVPAFDAGARAGLGEPVTAGTPITPAWRSGDAAPAEIRLPVYHHWQFATGPIGDFESLVQRLTPQPVPSSVGRRAMFIGAAGSGLPDLAPDVPGAVVGLEGALRPVDQKREPIPSPGGEAVATALQRLVDTGAERQPGGAGRTAPLGAPLYAHWPAQRHTIAGDTAAPAWLRSLNVDPRDRAAAAAGVRAVQANQEALVHSAWEQLGEAQSANRRLRELQVARAAATSVHRRHLAAMGAPDLVQLLGPAASRVRLAAATLHAEAHRSVLPDAALGAAFRKLTRPTGRLARATTATTATPAVRVDAMANLSSGAVTPMAARTAPDGAVLAAGMSQLTDGAGGAVVPGSGGLVVAADFVPRLTQLANVSTRLPRNPAVIARPSRDVPFLRRIDDDVELPDGPILDEPGDVADPEVPRRFQLAVEAGLPHLTFQVAAAEPPPPLALDDVATGALEATRPDARAALRAAARVAVPTGIARPPDPLAPVRGAPAFPVPLVELLGAVDREYVLPGLQDVEANTVGLVEVNRRFVEAALAGANYEMARELAWRLYPVERRATFFRRFWARPPGTFDIPAIDEWPAAADLGDNAFGSPEGELILIVRGDLIRRYPGTVIYAAQATFAGGRRVLVDPAVEVHPILSASLAPDVMLRGFPLTEAQVRGGEPDPLSNPTAGWFFVIASQPTEPRFGLDVAGDATPPTDRRKLNWSHMAPDGDLGAVSHATVGALAHPALGPLTWGRDAAQQAAITLQDPVRIVVHARHLLGPRRA
jgi:hypothetical protein